MQETQVWSLGQEDPLEKEMATYSSILAWEIPWTKEPGEAQPMGSQRAGHDWATKEVHTLDSQPSVIALLVLGPAASVGLCPKIRSDSLGLCAWGCRRMTRSGQERESWDERGGAI